MYIEYNHLANSVYFIYIYHLQLAIRFTFQKTRNYRSLLPKSTMHRREFRVRLERRRALEHRRLVSAPLLHIHRKDEGVKRTFAYVANNFLVSRQTSIRGLTLARGRVWDNVYRHARGVCSETGRYALCVQNTYRIARSCTGFCSEFARALYVGYSVE